MTVLLKEKRSHHSEICIGQQNTVKCRYTVIFFYYHDVRKSKRTGERAEEVSLIFTSAVHPDSPSVKVNTYTFMLILVVGLTSGPVSVQGGAAIGPFPRLPVQTNPHPSSGLFGDVQHFGIVFLVSYTGQVRVILSAVQLSLRPGCFVLVVGELLP